MSPRAGFDPVEQAAAGGLEVVGVAEDGPRRPQAGETIRRRPRPEATGQRLPALAASRVVE